MHTNIDMKYQVVEEITSLNPENCASRGITALQENYKIYKLYVLLGTT